MKTIFYISVIILMNGQAFASFDNSKINEVDNYIDQDILENDMLIYNQADADLENKINAEFQDLHREKESPSNDNKAANEMITDEVSNAKSGIQRSPAIINNSNADLDLNFHQPKTKERRVRSR